MKAFFDKLSAPLEGTADQIEARPKVVWFLPAPHRRTLRRAADASVADAGLILDWSGVHRSS